MSVSKCHRLEELPVAMLTMLDVTAVTVATMMMLPNNRIIMEGLKSQQKPTDKSAIFKKKIKNNKKSKTITSPSELCQLLFDD